MADFTKLLRPSTFEGFVGQAHLVGEHGVVKRLLLTPSFPHIFIFGPPGCGKTTLAKIIAKELELPFYSLNATDLKIDDLRKIFSLHKNTLSKPLIFIDEVHRLSKNQQEVLLPIMENSEVIIIGASTENPYFTLTSAIRSRSILCELFALSFDDLVCLLDLAGKMEPFSLDEDAKNYLISSSGGDARAMLKLLEYAVAIDSHVTYQNLKMLRPSSLSDGSSSDETHYNLTSAMIKSIRGSDVNASMYYFARLVKGGESAEFLARRLVILASEDIGNANPNALVLANAAMQSVVRIGWPESRIILAQVVIFLACCPKSNTSYKAIGDALKLIDEGVILDVPPSLKDTHFVAAHNLERGKGYLYPHDFGGWVDQKYLEKEIVFDLHLESGFEKTLKEWLDKIKSKPND